MTAERKIWDKSVMSWKNNQEVSAPFNGNKSASELFFDAYQGFSTKQNNREIRLAGHSLGSQMASSLMGQILDHNAASKQKLHIPERLILLDPFFSANGKEYLQDAWTGERVRDIVDRIQTRTSTSIEAYRSSAVGFAPVAADQNRPLTEKVAFIELNSTGFLSQLDQAAKHNYAPLHYFWSIDFPPPGTMEEDGATKVLGISASTPLKDIQTFIQSGLRARVVHGGDSASPRDDIHEVRAQ
ncbi:MAG: hypothetical protein HRU19_23050 [Pseudobacteriovorax sp.]|nr:hypothetical protein [Pseudobacteriovorax sp.]